MTGLALLRFIQAHPRTAFPVDGELRHILNDPQPVRNLNIVRTKYSHPIVWVATSYILDTFAYYSAYTLIEKVPQS